MAGTGGRGYKRDRAGWRRLGAFWVSVFLLMAVCGGVLSVLGPPRHAPPRAASDHPGDTVHLAAAMPSPAASVSPAATPAAIRPVLADPVIAGRDTPGPIADPDPILLEPLADGARHNLPRIGTDGRAAMRAYAAGFDPSSRRPRVAVLLAGIGLNAGESAAAIHVLPGAVSLAVSPYASEAANLPKLLDSARTTGHEYLVAIPMEPAGYPLNDPGPRALLTSTAPAENLKNLDWALSRIDGYVGATGVIGMMRGERLAAMSDQMDAVLAEFANRGLLYIDPREGHGPLAKAWGRHIDLVVDDPVDQGAADQRMVDGKLAALEQLAKDNGSALGLVMRPSPLVVARIFAWSNGLTERGLTLAPVSALVRPPAEPRVTLTERE